MQSDSDCHYVCAALHSSHTLTSVRQLLVPLMVTLLWLSMVAQMLMASPGT